MRLGSAALAGTLLLSAWTLLLGCFPGREAPPEGAGERRARVVFKNAGDGAMAVDVLGLAPGRLQDLRDRRLVGDAWHEVLTVYSGSFDPPPGQPPMLGTYQVLDDRLRFTPSFPLVPGFRYLARYEDEGSVAITSHYQSTRVTAEASTRLLAVYPAGEELPENLLRLYLHFSAPMSRGEAARRVRLEDSEGGEIPFPFVAPETELWSRGRDRLTLLLDPGRIKRGVDPNLRMGPPLTRGSEVRLVVDGGWPDGRGAPLAEGFAKRFRVGPADPSPPDPAAWLVAPPGAPDQPLTLTFAQSVDHALGLRLIEVLDEGGETIDGEAELAPGELTWSFRPAAAWKPGRYRIRIDPALEDPCGNSLGGAFETVVGTEAGAGRSAEPAYLDFQVGDST